MVREVFKEVVKLGLGLEGRIRLTFVVCTIHLAIKKKITIKSQCRFPRQISVCSKSSISPISSIESQNSLSYSFFTNLLSFTLRCCRTSSRNQVFFPYVLSLPNLLTLRMLVLKRTYVPQLIPHQKLPSGKNSFFLFLFLQGWG